MNGRPWTLARTWLARRSPGPVYLIHALNEHCNLSCGHCAFTGKPHHDQGNDLTLAEIRRVAEQLPPQIAFLLLTGGEPFLRPDLAEIVAAYAQLGGVPRIEIVTNGWMTESIVAVVQQILRESPDLILMIALSLDGVGEGHDRVRGRPGSFLRAWATLRALQTIARREPRLHLSVNVTFSAANQEAVDELHRFLLAQSGDPPPATTCTLVRGDPRDPATLAVDLDRYAGFVKRQARARADGRLGAVPGAVGLLVEAQLALAWRWVLRVARGEPPPATCLAGGISGVLKADGTVHACELRPTPLGNVREVGYQLAPIWNGGAAHAERRAIRAERCACTHECFIVANILFQPRLTPALLTAACALGLRRLARTLWKRRRIDESRPRPDALQQEYPWQHPASPGDGG